MHQSRLLHCSLVAIVVAVCSAAADCSGPACRPESECSGTVRVDPTGTDCSAKVAAGESILDSSCTSLQDVLEGLAALKGYSGEKCVAIELTAGLHTLTRTVAAIEQNVRITGEEAQRQPVLTTSSSQPPQEVSAACSVLETPTRCGVEGRGRGYCCPSQFLGCMMHCQALAFRFRK